MKKYAIFLLIFVILIMSGCTDNTEVRDYTVDMSPRLISVTSNMNTVQVVDAVKSAVVGISANLDYGVSVGSGVAIANDGYIITNQHVIGNIKSVKIYLADKTSRTAELIWSNPSLDIAVLKADISLPYLQTAPLTEVQVGDDVIAIGTPLSLQFKHTVTKGIVSALNRTLEVENDSGTISYMQDLIQHDASINAGNSGGPLINSSGKVIGINALKAADAEGIGFAIPIETATAVVAKVIPNNAFEQTYLGILGCDAEIAYYNDETSEKSGVYIMDIAENSPAFNSGLLPGDVITRINYTNIKYMLDMKKVVLALNPTDEIEIDYIQNGEFKTLKFQNFY
ncbi:MAG: trypsin-like peptidase domain-containing protein [Clostridia bacterium]|nr:trypsin-like peptidase domain-containing protein [Clostridia bacterium]